MQEKYTFFLKIKHKHTQKNSKITYIHIKIHIYIHKCAKIMKFLPNNIESMWISYKTQIKSKHICSITQQFGEDIHTHTHPKAMKIK